MSGQEVGIIPEPGGGTGHVELSKPDLHILLWVLAVLVGHVALLVPEPHPTICGGVFTIVNGSPITVSHAVLDV